MTEKTPPQAIHLKDYRAPDYFIPRTGLHVDLQEDVTRVTATLQMQRNPAVAEVAALTLHGSELVLRAIAIDGRALAADEFIQSENALMLHNPPVNFELTLVTEIKPQLNKSLEGLYKSRTMYCTQCEAEGFRKITY